MAKDFWFSFGTGDARTNTGLTPTFVIFHTRSTTLTPPGVTEPIVGTGMYLAQFNPTLGIIFQLDGGAALSTADRYLKGAFDPVQAVDEKIGFTTDSFGSTAIDPATLLAYAKRNQEFDEGNMTFNKSTGVWNIYSRGSSTLLKEKTLTDSASTATKT